MATIKLTPEQAAEKLYKCHSLDFRENAIAVAKEKVACKELIMTLPQELPLDRNGDPFIPGLDCDGNCREIMKTEYSILTGRPNSPSTEINVATGIFRQPTDGGRPRFELTRPEISTHILATIYYAGGEDLPELITPKSQLGHKLQVAAAWRTDGDTAEWLTSDCLVLVLDGVWREFSIFKSSCLALAHWAVKEIAAGDVYANTCRAVRPVYRAYMEDILLPQHESLKKLNLDWAFDEEACHLFIRSDGGLLPLCSYRYTLKDTQEMARRIFQDSIVR